MVVWVGPVGGVLRVTVVINDAAVGSVEIVMRRLAVLLGDGSRAAQAVLREPVFLARSAALLFPSTRLKAGLHSHDGPGLAPVEIVHPRRAGLRELGQSIVNVPRLRPVRLLVETDMSCLAKGCAFHPPAPIGLVGFYRFRAPQHG